MRLNNTTPEEDRTLTQAEEFSFDEVLSVVQRLDTELTKATDRISELENELKELRKVVES